MTENVVWLNDVSISDIEKVGGKNASLGEMISGLSSQGIQVPGGFATTAEAFESFFEPFKSETSNQRATFIS